MDEEKKSHEKTETVLETTEVISVNVYKINPEEKEKLENFSNDSSMELIRGLTENEAKTFLNLIYAILKDNEIPNEKLISQVLSIYEKRIPRMVKARQNN
ncbi:hypothetical protein [Paenibacillus sp. Marseille-Q4541]|uniref:hypothetical protein n=1 Tax=Paenibacillus sp. Marseille-Q4541 TaxID=2831522 RepID=UPI001BABCC4A|nr:hypothetical protein [Paenibacillus sp. Marseille-Q4541]